MRPHHQWQSIKGSWSSELSGKVKRNMKRIHFWNVRLWQNAGRVKSWKCTTMGENQWKSMCNKSILKTSNVWNNCMRKKWWSRLKFPSVAKNNLSKMRTVMFCATFVLHFLICIISSIYFAFPILWQYSERLQWPHSPNPKNYIPSQHRWSACLSEIFWETNICWIIYQDATFKICLSLFGWKVNIVPKMHIVQCKGFCGRFNVPFPKVPLICPLC